MGKNNNIISELLLISGGFILAETVIRWFLSLSEGTMPSWILPTLSILFIITALEINKNGLLNSGIIGAIFLTISVILIVFMKAGFIIPVNFLWSILILSIMTIIVQFILFLYRKK